MVATEESVVDDDTGQRLGKEVRSDLLPPSETGHIIASYKHCQSTQYFILIFPML